MGRCSCARSRSSVLDLLLTLILSAAAGLATDGWAQDFGPATALNTNAASDSGSDIFPRLATDGLGAWVAVWRSNDTLGDTAGTDSDIFVSRSVDAGATWTPAAILNSYGLSDSGIDHTPQVATDGAGNWVAIWSSWETLGGALGPDADILMSRSTDAGASWTVAQAIDPNVATDRWYDYDPELTTDGAGSWVAVWRANQLVPGPYGTDTEVLTSRSTDAGLTWSAPTPLNDYAATDTGHDNGGQVTVDGAGTWVAIWSAGESFGGVLGIDQDILTVRSIDGGATWDAATLVNTNAGGDSGSDVNPQLATDGAGLWVAVWRSDDPLTGIGTDFDILTSRSTNAGISWSFPVPLNTNAWTDTGDDEFPHLSTDGAGSWVATWQSTDPLGGTIGTDADVLWARSTDGGVTWTAPAALDENAAGDVGDDFRPNLTNDGAGRWIATWYSYDSFGGTIGTDGDVIVSLGSGPGAAAPALGTLGLVGMFLILLAAVYWLWRRREGASRP